MDPDLNNLYYLMLHYHAFVLSCTLKQDSYGIDYYEIKLARSKLYHGKNAYMVRLYTIPLEERLLITNPGKTIQDILDGLK